jgi:hypothetical protein
MISAVMRAVERRKAEESKDPVLFARRCGLTPDPWQTEVLRSDARQMILLCSRQSGKSTVTSVLALHEAIYNAPALVLLLSPSLRQSQELFDKIKSAYDSLLDAPRSTQETALTLRVDNGSRIVALPGATDAKIRGFSGAALIVIDEASRVTDDLYQAVRPMIAVSGGRLVLLSSPFGRRGFFHHEWTEGGPDWHRTKITAYQCPRMSKEWLDAERGRIGDWWFKQEYLCEFTETVDSVFSYEDIERALDPAVAPLFGAS